MTEREYLVALGNNVKATRNRMGLTVDKLSVMLDFDPRTITRIELAHKAPHITTLRKIALALRTDVRHLLP